VDERLESPLVEEMDEGEGEREPLWRASKGDREFVPGCKEGDLPLPAAEGVTGRAPTKVSDLARIRLRLRSESAWLVSNPAKAWTTLTSFRWTECILWISTIWRSKARYS
jgi:hypothetical protein